MFDFLFHPDCPFQMIFISSDSEVGKDITVETFTFFQIFIIIIKPSGALKIGDVSAWSMDFGSSLKPLEESVG